MPPEITTELLKLGFPGIAIIALCIAVYKLYSGRLSDWEKTAELNTRMAVALEQSNETLKAAQTLSGTLVKTLESQTTELRQLGSNIADLETSCRLMREDMLRGMRPA